MDFFKSSKGKFAATVILAPGLLLLILYGIVWKLFIEIRNSSYAVSAGRSSLEFSGKRLVIAEENQKALEDYAEDVERMKKTIFYKERPLEFIETLENIARLSGSIIEITPIEGKDSLNIFLVSAEGDFPSLFKFLKLIEVMKYQVVIEEANFEKSSSVVSVTGQAAKSAAVSGQMRLNLTLKTGI